MNNIDIDNIDNGLLAFAWDNLSPRDRAKVTANAPSTVWILGAGASHHYNLNARGVPLPLANGFFKIFNSLPTSEGFQAHVGPLISYLYHSRGIAFDEMYTWEENIEDFMTSIESKLDQLRERKNNCGKLSEDDMQQLFLLAPVFANMNFIFGNVLNEAQNGPSCSLYHELLKFCAPNDTFVTFNWDTLLDRALTDTGGWSPAVGYGISFSSVLDGIWKKQIESSANFPANWRLLKLHGSTNWLVPYIYVNFDTLEFGSLFPNSDIFLYWQSTLPYETFKGRWRGGYVPTCYCYYPPNLPLGNFSDEQLSAGNGKIMSWLTHKGIFAPFDEPSESGIPSAPLLITPVRQKKYDIYQTIFDRIWKLAEDALLQSERIVIIGYSFPPTDVKPLKMLRDVLNSRESTITIEIVAPNANDVASQIGNEYLSKAGHFAAHSMTFEDYVQQLWQSSPDMVKQAASQNSKIDDWVKRIHTLREWSLNGYQK